jgi:hypothetical protein
MRASGEVLELQVDEDLLTKVRNLHVFWVPFEAGAPIIYPAAVLPESFENFGELTPDELRSMQAAQIMMDCGHLEAGVYALENFWISFYPEGTCPVGADTKAQINIPRDSVLQFEVTEAHLKLLAEANTSESGFNFKRPYGDMTFHYLDIAAALGMPVPRKADGSPDFTESEFDNMDRLHGEMLFTVQALLRYGSLELGTYARKSAYDYWEPKTT